MNDIEKLAHDFAYYYDDQWHFDTEFLKQFAEAYAAKVLEDKEREITRLTFISTTLKDNIDELQAHINDLSEALEDAYNELGGWVEIGGKCPESVINALSKTPAQSLREHDNEVVERIAYIFNDEPDAVRIMNKIRALKGKQDE